MYQTNSFVGIDPGNGGGIAVLIDDADETEVITRKFPEDVRDIGIFLRTATSNTNYRVAIEKVHSMPKQGVKSTFTFGMNYGIWIGALRTLDIDFIIKRFPPVFDTSFNGNLVKAPCMAFVAP